MDDVTLKTEASTEGLKEQVSKNKLLAKLKAYAWRVTALYLWVKVISVFTGWYSYLASAESHFVNRFILFLSSIGFEPVNTNILSTVFKIVWLLVITWFSLLELLVFLFFYVLAMPLWLPIALALRKYWRSLTQTGKQEPAQVSDTDGKGKWVFPAVSLFFGAWFLLYGNATRKNQLIPGVILSGLFSVILIYRLLLKPDAPSEMKLPVVRWLSLLSNAISTGTLDRQKKVHSTKSEVEADQKFSGFIRRFVTRLTKLIKRSLAHRRIPNYVLAEYVISLVIVAGTSMLFWALLIKFGVYPQLSLTTAFHLSASHFLPSVQPPALPFTFPLWSSLGPAATAWVLFVLYIGPAASLLPDKQRASLAAMQKIYAEYRQSVLTLGREKRWLRSRLEEL